jgi:RNA polymerase sigma factor (sigma-70 family)
VQPDEGILREPSAGGLCLPSESRTQADLDAFSSGDSRAFERIWQRLRPACEILLAGRFRASLEPSLRSQLEADLEDILQESSLTIFRQLPGFEYRGQGSLLAWAGTIALRAARDRVAYWKAGKRSPRSRRPAASASTDPSRASSASVAEPGPGPASRLCVAEKRRQLAEALATLPERFQTIVLWRFFAGAGWAEIAAEVGSPSGEAVKMECLLKVLPAIAAALPRQRSAAEGSR